MAQSYLPGATNGKIIFNNLSKEYEDVFGDDRGLHRNMERFLSYLPTDARVLDCGSGTGRPVCQMIAESGRSVHGIDLSPKMIELSRKQVPKATFELCNMLEYSPRLENFGGVTATLSLFELTRAELTSMAQKWFQWIQPGGYLLICTMGAEDCAGTRAEMYDADGECASGIDWTFMGYKVYLTLFTKTGWKKLLEYAGFEVVHEEIDEFKLPPEAKCDDETHFFVIARKPTIDTRAET